jgi:hypothetical protein
MRGAPARPKLSRVDSILAVKGDLPVMRALLVAAVVAALLALPTVAAAAAPLKLSAKPTRVEPGESIVVKYAVKRHPAKLVLRLDGKRLRTVRVAKARGRATVTLPRRLAPGAHRLTACIKQVCRSQTLRVRRAAPAPPPAESPSPAPPAPQLPAPEPTPAPPPAMNDFTGDPNPLGVQAHTDPSHGAAKTIGFAGGTLETTGADGTHYKLTVPAGALLSDERVSLTPITTVDGLPFSRGLAAGVQLEPSGLRFGNFVTLEVTGHPPVPADEETGFLYQQDGDEFQLYPVQEDAGKTTFRIMHFSGVGIARGTEAERNAQLLRATTDVEGRLTQQLAALFRPGEPVDSAAVEATLRAFHDQIIKPLVTAALTDDGLAVQAINKYLGWGRLVQLLADDEFMAEERRLLTDQWIEIIKNAAVKAHRRCVDESRPEELPSILSWWRQLSLMGLADEMPTDLWTAISSCARFELDFHTKIVQEHEFNVEGPELWKGEAFAENVIIEPDPQTLQQRGTKAAQYVDFRVEIPPHEPGTGCWRGGGDWARTFPFTVARLEMDLNPIQRPDGSYGYPEFERGRIAVSVTPFSTREYQFWADCGGSTGEGGWGTWLGITFLGLHQDEQGEFGSIVFTDWTVPAGGGSLLGAKTYFRTKTVTGDKTSEETTLELYHAPIR